MTKRVAWFTGQATNGSVTPHKVYDVFNEDGDYFNLKDDNGGTRLCLKEQCAHICHGDWVFADVVEEDMKVETVKFEAVKRKGAMTLLPEDSKFEIGQRVQVDRSGYIGYTTIIGYNYDYDEYATECDKDNDCSHDCEGLAKEKGKGLWVAESDIIESVEAKQPKWSEWIKNTTGKCPEGLKRKQKIKLKWSDGDKFVITNPHDAAWYIDNGESAVNITHYKVKLKDVSIDNLDEQPKQNTDWQDNLLGVRPVPKYTVVEVELKCGEILKGCWFNWGETPMKGREIVKWRLA